MSRLDGELRHEILKDNERGLAIYRHVLRRGRVAKGVPGYDLYVKALGDICLKELRRLTGQPQGPTVLWEAVQLLAWLDQHKPGASDIEALIEGVYEAPVRLRSAEAWCSLVEFCSEMLPEVLRPSELLARAGEIRYVLKSDRIACLGLTDYEGLSLKKRAGSIEWVIVDDCGREHGHALKWGIVLGSTVEAQSIAFMSADGKKVVTLLVSRVVCDEVVRAATCERVDDKWSGWSVATGKDAQRLARKVLTYPSPTEARVGGVWFQAGVPEGDVGCRWENGAPRWLARTKFDPEPQELWVIAKDGAARLRFPTSKVSVSHPGRYRMDLDTLTGWVYALRLMDDPYANQIPDQDPDQDPLEET